MKEQKSKTHFPKLSQTGTTFKDSEENPFFVPDDSQIFRINDIDKDRKREERKHHQSLRIWEKGGKQKTGLTMKDLRTMGKSETDEEPFNVNRISLIEAAKSAIKNRVKVNEPMHEYIDKKRQMLLFQMLIDHKRQQINQYQELTRRHKKGLQMAEQYLDQDTQSFNTYLGQNKVEARNAIKQAEQMTRKKNEKISILKVKLQVKADLTGKNTSKEQTVENLLRYKQFLDGLLFSNETKPKKKKTVINTNHNITNPQILELLQQQDEKDEMTFKNPAQLMNIFVNLQQQNLFLMGNLKTIQQNIEIVRGNFNVKKKGLDNKKQQLLATKNETIKQTSLIEKEIEHIKSQTNKQQTGDLINNLQSEIIRSCREFGEKGFSDQKLVAIEFLKDIEKRLESQIKYLVEARESHAIMIQNIEKYCSNDKREKKKLKNEQEIKELALQQKAQDANHKQKRHGRPIMAKSKLKVEQKEVEVEDQGPKEEQIERKKYLT